MKRRRRYRKNPSPVATAALVGGAGIIGYILYKHYSQPTYVAPAPAAKGPDLWSTILGTGLSFVASERDKQIAADKAKAAATSQAGYQWQSSLFGMAPQCVSLATKKAVADSYCGGKTATAGALGRIDGGFRDPNLPWGAKRRKATVFSSIGGKGSLG